MKIHSYILGSWCNIRTHLLDERARLDHESTLSRSGLWAKILGEEPLFSCMGLSFEETVWECSAKYMYALCSLERTLHNNNSTAHSRHCVVFSMLHVSICPVVASVALSVQTPQYTCPRGCHGSIANPVWHRVITICRRAASRLGCSPGGRRRPPRRHRLVGPRMRSEAHLQLHHAVVRVSEQPDAL